MAIPSARTIVIGEVVTDVTDLHLTPADGSRHYALRLTEVLRGDSRVGDLLDVEYLEPNWPQVPSSVEPYELWASCRGLSVRSGETIVMAFDALIPRGSMLSGHLHWIQPPTRYNAVGVIVAKGRSG